MDGVPVQEKGRSQDVFEHVVRMFGEAGAVNLMDILIEPIELVKTTLIKKSSKKCKSIIFKFITFWHQTIVYRLKKNMKDNIKVHVDPRKKSTVC